MRTLTVVRSYNSIRICFSASFSLYHCCFCLVIQSCPSLCDPMDCSPPGSSAHGISQARTLEWVAISFSRGSSPPRDQTQVSCTANGFSTILFPLLGSVFPRYLAPSTLLFLFVIYILYCTSASPRM